MTVVLIDIYLSQVWVYEDTDRIQAQAGTVTPLLSDGLYKRRVAEILLDVGLVSLAYYAAYRLRFGGEAFSIFAPSFLASLPLVLGVQVFALFAVGGYRGLWRYFGLMDSIVYAKGVLIGTLAIVLSVTYLYRFELYSRGVFAIYAALTRPPGLSQFL